MTELEKMYGGRIFDSHFPEFAPELKRSRRLCEEYNALGVDDEEIAKCLAEKGQS